MINHLNETNITNTLKAKVFEGISDFHKRVKEGFAANDVLLQLKLEMSVHENKRFNK